MQDQTRLTATELMVEAANAAIAKAVAAVSNLRKPRCKTCKYYKTEDMQCTNRKLASLDNDGMVASTGWSEGSELTGMIEGDDEGPKSVGPDFGCIHHETID